jgi:hypothetical protein
MSATPAESLRLETTAPPRVRVGEPVPITVRVTNTGATAAELYLMGRSPTFDVTITRVGGRVVWRRLEGEIAQAILQHRVLSPGESLELRHEWDQRSNDGGLVGAGSYVVEGSVITDARPLRTAAVPLRIVPLGE